MHIKNKRLTVRRRRRFFLHFRWIWISLLLFASILFVFLATSILFRKISVLSPVTWLYQHDTGIIDGSQKALVVRDLLQRNHIVFRSVYSVNGAIVIIPEKGQIVLFSPNKDFSVQIASLQLVTSHFTIEGKHFTRLDFRYDKPVITF